VIKQCGSGPASARSRCWRRRDKLGLTDPFDGNSSQMSITAAIILAVFVFLTSVLVIALFIWAAVKDGQEDKALQTRLGIRRRTRIGR
jgi:hypothetical protein